MTAEPLPDWFMPPPGGWTADDMDNLPPGVPRMELIDGALIVMSPHTWFHGEAMYTLMHELRLAAPEGFSVIQEMTVKLGKHQRPEPDIVVYRRPSEPLAERRRRTHVAPEDVVLAVEVVSSESQFRDREVKPKKYAEAGIPHFWRVEDEGERTAIHVYELDETTKSYVAKAIVRDRLKTDLPFDIDIDVTAIAMED
jgi:Uma2 family endonuclease